MRQGTLCSHWSTTVSEQGSAGTGLCINALPSFCSKAHLPTSQRSGMEWQKERDWQSVLHTEPCASLCSHWSLLHSQLPAMWRTGDNSVHISCSADFPCLLHEPVELWERDLAWCALSLTSAGTLASPSPCHKNPLNSAPQHRECMFAEYNTQVWARQMIRENHALLAETEK